MYWLFAHVLPFYVVEGSTRHLTDFKIWQMLGMKVYITDYEELIVEPSLKWAGNPNVFVSIKAFGLKATAQVSCFLHSYFLLSSYLSVSVISSQ